MRRFLVFLITLISVLAVICTAFVVRTQFYAYAAQPTASIKQVCANTGPGTAHCNAMQLMKTTSGVTPLAVAPSGLNPASLQAAYQLPSSSAGSGQTVAIVDAFDDPNAEADLGSYRSQFGLAACTTANGCFKKVNQTGGTSYPTANASWAEEISLDLDMVSAVCPNCHILLVEATSSSLNDLGTSVNEAVALGANVVSNSYGGGEFTGETALAADYNHAGVVITASSGDAGFGVQMPAAFNTVVAVGGTSLTTSNSARGWTEAAWSGAGSGCSAFISKPTWQTDTACTRRTNTDVSAIADPRTGVSVFDSFGGVGGWVVVGGTSVSSPIIASIYGLAGNAGSVNAASTLYSHTASLFDVTSGSNGSCGGTYLCTAGVGYDGPTGLGTPDGIAAF